MTRSDQACLLSLPIGWAGQNHVQPYAVCDSEQWGVDGIKEVAGIFPAGPQTGWLLNAVHDTPAG